MRLPVRAIASSCVLAFVASGCGLLGRPSVTSSEEVQASLRELADGGFRSRVTAELTLDEQELRNALSSNPKALDAFRKEMGESDATADDLLAELEKAQDMLEPHALLLEVGDDQSVRYAVETAGTVWADMRLHAEPRAAVADQEGDGDATADGFSFTMQAQADIAYAAEQLGATAPDTDELLAGMGPALAELPGGQAALDLVTAFLGGDLVEVSGEVGPDMFEGVLGAGAGDDVAGSFPTDLADLGFDPQQLLDDAVVFDGFRVEDEMTVVDVSVNVRDGARSFAEAAERMAENDPTGAVANRADMPTEAELAELPETLTNVARLYLDASGTLTQIRVDVLDIGVQLARHSDPDDAELAAAADLASALENSGAFMVMEISGIGSTPTVLSDAAAVLSVEEIVELAGGFFGAMLGGFNADMLADLEGLEDLEGLDSLEGLEQLNDFGNLDDLDYPHPNLRPSQVVVGDCFTNEAMFSFGSPPDSLSVPCSEPHGFEAYFSFELALPGYDFSAIQDELSTTCIEEFERYVGIDYFESDLFLDSLFPSEPEWSAGDRTAVCYVSSFDDLVGSVKGSGR